MVESFTVAANLQCTQGIYLSILESFTGKTLNLLNWSSLEAGKVPEWRLFYRERQVLQMKKWGQTSCQTLKIISTNNN